MYIIFISDYLHYAVSWDPQELGNEVSHAPLAMLYSLRMWPSRVTLISLAYSFVQYSLIVTRIRGRTVTKIGTDLTIWETTSSYNLCIKYNISTLNRQGFIIIALQSTSVQIDKKNNDCYINESHIVRVIVRHTFQMKVTTEILVNTPTILTLQAKFNLYMISKLLINGGPCCPTEYITL